MPDKTTLVTRTRNDEGTNYLYYWAEVAIKEIDGKSNRVIELKEENVTKKKFESIIKKMKPEFIFINGHGGYDYVTGHNQKEIVRTGINEDILKNTITYALACSSAFILGHSAIKKGAKAYVGYNQPFHMPYKEHMITHPLQDEWAKLFLEPSNLLVTTIAKGHTVEEAFKRSQAAFKRNISKLTNSETSKEQKGLLWLLNWDMKCQALCGNPNATI